MLLPSTWITTSAEGTLLFDLAARAHGRTVPVVVAAEPHQLAPIFEFKC